MELQWGQWAEAARAYNTVISADPLPQEKSYLSRAYYGLARVVAAQGKWEEAQQDSQTSLTYMGSTGYHLTTGVRQWLDNLLTLIAERNAKKEEPQAQ